MSLPRERIADAATGSRVRGPSAEATHSRYAPLDPYASSACGARSEQTNNRRRARGFFDQIIFCRTAVVFAMQPKGDKQIPPH
jgi:hypothetical protein